MKIGTSRYCLTPENQFYLIGFRSPNRFEPASGVHDDIYCNSLLFEENGKELFLFSADFLEFEEEMAEDVKTMMQETFGLERDMVLLCATHNHSSVVSYHKSWYTGKFDQSYYDRLLEIIKDSYRTCQENAREASARFGKKTILGYYGNRNHPGEPADNEVIVVKFLDESGNAFAGLINWAVHSTVISAENTWLTAELAGNVSKKLGDTFGFYPAMVVGAAGDCSNRNERQGNDFNELERVSTLLAKDIADIEVDQELELGEIQYQTLFHTIHNLPANPDDKPFHLDAKASVIQLGSMQLFVFPGELGSAFGIQLKQAYDGLGIVSGYTNGYYEYFLPASEYGLSFETSNSKIPEGEPEKLIQKFIQASEMLKNRRKTNE